MTMPTQGGAPMLPSSMSDHDLLVTMNTKLDMALSRVEDHETRIRTREAADADLDARVKAANARTGDVEVTVKDHAVQLTRLNKITYIAMGVAAAGGGTIGSLVTGMLNGHG